MTGDSSNSVANRTNWSNLADYLKVERGVNDQGVNLLKKAYNQFDSDHNWRPENSKAIGTERWAAAVKAAKEYIDKNYKVSGGNYFRLNADGSIGDNVSTVHSTNDEARAQRDRIRMMSRESTFNKFDKLPLEEQLNLLKKVDTK